MRQLEDRVVAVTGAALGLGRAVSLELARLGCHLALADIDARALAETARHAQRHGRRVSTTELDVRDRGAVFAWAERVVSDHGQVHVVVNNAGVNLNAAIEDTTAEDLEWVLATNFWGVVHGTQAFLPFLRRADWAHIVNVSSVYGLIATPRQSGYHAAKFAIRGFTEALGIELDAEGSRVGVTVVHPGGIRTDIVRNVRTRADAAKTVDIVRTFDRLARTSPEQAAKHLVRGIVRNQRRVLIGADARLIDAAQRWFPVLYQKVLAEMLRRRR